MTQLEDCIEKLVTVPNDTNRHLRHIRQLDKKIEEGMPKLAEKQREFLEKARLYKERKQDLKELDPEYNQIIKLQKLYYGMGLEKVKVAEQLKQVLRQPSVELQLKVKAEVKIQKTEDVKQDMPMFKKKKIKAQTKVIGKGDKKEENKEWLYDKYMPVYCYCGQGSFGEMVECEYPFCEREWFHRDCLGQKVANDQEWFCTNCRKLRDTMNSSTMKYYLK